MNPVTSELWPVASRPPKGISSHPHQGFDTTKQRDSDFSAYTLTCVYDHIHNVMTCRHDLKQEKKETV